MRNHTTTHKDGIPNGVIAAFYSYKKMSHPTVYRGRSANSRTEVDLPRKVILVKLKQVRNKGVLTSAIMWIRCSWLPKCTTRFDCKQQTNLQRSCVSQRGGADCAKNRTHKIQTKATEANEANDVRTVTRITVLHRRSLRATHSDVQLMI